jgi:hypothetical protein
MYLDKASPLPAAYTAPDEFKSTQKLYSRIQLPLISISLVDSLRSKEVIHISVWEIDVRHFEADKYTDSMVNVTWIQVDNQLTDASASVILSPIQAKVHQPIVRIKIRKNSALSKQDITSYDAIEVIVQEVDLRLEQQIVLACWDLYQSLLSEVRATLASVGTVTSDDLKPSIDSLGFSTSSTSHSSNGYDLIASFKLLLQGHFFEKIDSKQNSSGSKKSPPDSSPKISEQNISPAAIINFREELSSNAFDLKFDIVGNEMNHTIYIEHLYIGPIKINISFLTTHAIISSSSSSSNTNSDTISASAEGLGILSTVAIFFRQVGEVALNLTSSISDAPIFFAGKN